MLLANMPESTNNSGMLASIRQLRPTRIEGAASAVSTQRRADRGTQARGRADDLGAELDDGVAGDFVVFRGAVRVAVDDGEGPLPRPQIHAQQNAAAPLEKMEYLYCV